MNRFLLFLVKHKLLVLSLAAIIVVYGGTVYFKYHAFDNYSLEEIKGFILDSGNNSTTRANSAIDKNTPASYVGQLLRARGKKWLWNYYDGFKQSTQYGLLTLPQRIMFWLSFEGSKAIPMLVIAIILLIMLIRTRYSVMTDVYRAERETLLRNINEANVDAIDAVQMPDVIIPNTNAEPKRIVKIDDVDMKQSDEMDVF